MHYLLWFKICDQLMQRLYAGFMCELNPSIKCFSISVFDISLFYKVKFADGKRSDHTLPQNTFCTTDCGLLKLGF